MPLQNVKLYLDGTGKQREFVRALKNGVRQICNAAGSPEQNFQEIRILNSTHPLIQCADMLTGAVAEQVRQGHSSWLENLQIDRRVWWEEKFDEKQNPSD
jgi:hypothetical protein